jgi:hypothetical protein
MAAKKEKSIEEVIAKQVFDTIRDDIARLCRENKLEQAQMSAQEAALGYYKSFEQEKGDILTSMAKTIWKFRGMTGDLF